MKSIGEQVREFRGLQKPPWNTSDMAKAIGGNVKRQHIEQLEANSNRLPHYIVKLAQVMDKSCDELLGNRRDPPPPAGYSADAIKLATWFDRIKGEQNRFAAYGAATHALAPFLPSDDQPPTRKPRSTDPTEKQRAKPQRAANRE